MRAARFTDEDWELYDLGADPTEITDLAELEPDKLAELAAGFHEAALANQVYPMDEGSGWRWLIRPPHDDVFHEPVTIWPGTPTLERIRSGVWSGTARRPITIDVEHAGRRPRRAGVPRRPGRRVHAWRSIDEHLWFVHNDGHGTTTVADAGALAAGRHSIVLTLGAPGGGRWSASVAVDGTPTIEGLDLRLLLPMAPFTGIAVGADRGSPVGWERYERDRPLPVHRAAAQRALRARAAGARRPPTSSPSCRRWAPSTSDPPTFGPFADRIPRRRTNGERSPRS